MRIKETPFINSPFIYQPSIPLHIEVELMYCLLFEKGFR